MANLGNPQETIAVLQRYGFNFQKKYGQNFLIDTHVLDKIIGAAEIGKDDFVLEIGPGIGTMTQYLAEAAREVVAVEIDTKLIPILEDTLKEYDNVTVLNEDILNIGEVYTEVPRGPVDGIYGERTKEAVRQFQSVFGLGQTGVVDYPTWYKIQEIYVGITRIAELY